VKDLSRDVAFEGSDDLAPRLALDDATLVVLPGAGVEAQPGLHNAVQGCVGLPVAAAVEPAVLPTVRGTLDGAGPAQRGEGRLAAQTLRIVPIVISRVTAVSGPMPTTRSSCGRGVPRAGPGGLPSPGSAR
jgi:hypothetical protein